MAKQTPPSSQDWFRKCGSFAPGHDVDKLRQGIETGYKNEQDEYGMTALSLAAMWGWKEGVDELLRAGADTELRYFQTGATTLLMAVQNASEPIIESLMAAGANSDAPNYWGLTPRSWSSRMALKRFDHVPQREMSLPPPRIQNAE